MNKLIQSKQTPKVVNIGSSIFLKDLSAQHVEHVNVQYQPPGQGNEELVSWLLRCSEKEEVIHKANQEALTRVLAAQAKLIAVMPAIQVIPGMTDRTFLHAGPPIPYEKMAGPMKGAILGAIVFEGLAKNLSEAEAVIKQGLITFAPAHEHHAVGPMAGIISQSMPVHVVENPIHKNTAYC